MATDFAGKTALITGAGAASAAEFTIGAESPATERLLADDPRDVRCAETMEMLHAVIPAMSADHHERNSGTYT